MKVKILVVDDSGVMRKMIIQTIFKGSVFNAENAEMIQAGDGMEGVEAFKWNSPHVVLTDWNMPKLNGFEMVKQIREINKEIPIIVISSEGTAESIKQALDQKLITDFISKPLTPNSVEQKLLQHLKG